MAILVMEFEVRRYKISEFFYTLLNHLKGSINPTPADSNPHLCLLTIYVFSQANCSLGQYRLWNLKSRDTKLSDRFNRIKTRTIRRQECEGPRGVVRSEFEVDVDRSTYRYRLSVEALSVGIFIGNPARGGIHNIAGVCSHQRGRHKYAHFYLSKKFLILYPRHGNSIIGITICVFAPLKSRLFSHRLETRQLAGN